MPTAQSLSSFDEALQAHLTALRARDIEGFAQTLSHSSEVRVVGPHGDITTGYDAIRASHAEWFAAREAWVFDSRELWRRVGSDLALALHAVTYRDSPVATPVGFLLLFAFAREPDGAWRLVYDQNTTLACNRK